MTENIYLPGQFTSLSPKSHSSKNLCPPNSRPSFGLLNCLSVQIKVSPCVLHKFLFLNGIIIFYDNFSSSNASLDPIDCKSSFFLRIPMKCTDPHDVDDVLTAHRPVVFVVSSAPRRDGGGAGAAPADCWEEFNSYHNKNYITCHVVQLTLVLPEGGQGGDAGHVLLVRAGGHVAQRLQLPLGAVITHVAVQDRGWRVKIKHSRPIHMDFDWILMSIAFQNYWFKPS